MSEDLYRPIFVYAFLNVDTDSQDGYEYYLLKIIQDEMVESLPHPPGAKTWKRHPNTIFMNTALFGVSRRLVGNNTHH